jgi:hypothetical protein
MDKKMRVEDKKNKERTKGKNKRGEEGRERKRGNFFQISRKGEPVKRRKKNHLNVWFGLG